MNRKFFFPIVLVGAFLVNSPLVCFGFDRDSYISQIQGQAEEGDIEALL